MRRINDIKLNPNENESLLTAKCSEILGCSVTDIKDITIIKKSIDARHKDKIFIIYTVDVNIAGDTGKEEETAIVCVDSLTPENKPKKNNFRPIIVGFGPAGMFAALSFIRAGVRPIIFERGSKVEDRVIKVNKFWVAGVPDFDTNVQFGEGGAGTFSDGKLTTGKNSIHNNFILNEFVKHGAPEDIKYLHKSHIGTDNLISIVKNIRNTVLNAGSEIYFNTSVTDLLIKNARINGVIAGGKEYLSTQVILAIGHSAHDIYNLLDKKSVAMQAKPFSIGVRIEHLQEEINKSQYGNFYNCKNLGAADYKLVYHNKLTDRSAYTFCMCPGGAVVASGSSSGEVVTNGMSNYLRDGKNANSALLVGVGTKDFEGILGGLDFRQKIENKAYISGGANYHAPVQTVGDFLNGKTGHKGNVLPTYRPGVKYTDINSILPRFVSDTLKAGIKDMGRRLKCFDNPEAIITGVETRSSSPVTVIRGENLMSINTEGLYPCGEGCGYAGGIMSAAADGIKVAQLIIQNN